MTIALAASSPITQDEINNNLWKACDTFRGTVVNILQCCQSLLYQARGSVHGESLQGRIGESTRQVEGLFESLLAESFS